MVDVDRGLFILRYVSGAASGPSPIAMLRAAEGSESFVEILSAPGLVNGFLAGPGDCAVIRAERPSRLELKIRPQGAGGSLDASFRVDPVWGSAAPPSVVDSRRQIGGHEAGDGAFKLVAHVARRGDVAADPGVWIAGPEAPAAIEAVGIRGSLPAGVGIEIQPLLGTSPPRWLDWAPSGSFVGTRGRALPLAGLRMRVTGPQGVEGRLAVDALFLGSPITSQEGREVEIVGPAGNEPLVGLRVGLVMATDQREEAAQASATADSGPVERTKESRIRVFRAAEGA
ncbi:hypothetical protein [Rhodoblastus sp.]|uniref:hypothetical protein n=1 Tax=Rhodoblastus sp. TaxID=1962975 RepID=UPI00263892CA|nr:hypothetical protein [Rhodoblastus sp.]